MRKEKLSDCFKKCNSLEIFEEILSEMECKIGSHGGRHFIKKNSDKKTEKEYLTYNMLVSKFSSICSESEQGSCDIEDIEELRKKISKLNEEGNKKLNESSNWQRFGTIWRKFANIKFTFNRERVLNNSLAKFKEAEEKFIGDITEEFNKAFEVPPISLNSVSEKVKKIKNKNVYLKLLNKIAENSNLSKLDQLKRVRKIPLPSDENTQYMFRKVKAEFQAKKVIELGIDDVEKIRNESSAFKREEKSSYGNTVSLALTLDWSQNEDTWPLNLLIYLEDNLDLKNNFCEKLAENKKTAKSPAGKERVEKYTLKGKKDEVVAEKLIKPKLSEQNYSILMRKWPENTENFTIEFPDPIKIERGLRLVTRTMASGKVSDFSAVDDLLIAAENWRHQLKIISPDSRQKEIVILEKLIDEIKSKSINDDNLVDLKINFPESLTAIPAETDPSDSEEVTGSSFANTDLEKGSMAFEFSLEESNPDSPEKARVKFINKFMGQLLGDEYPIQQIMLKHQLFIDFQEAFPSWTEDPDLLQWGRDVLVHLQNACEKLSDKKEVNVEQVKNSLGIVFEQIKCSNEKIREAENKIKQLSPPVLSDIMGANSVFANCLSLSEHISPEVKSKVVTQEKLEVPPRIHLPIDFSDFQNAAKKTDEWISYIDELAANEQYDDVDRAAMMFLEQFRDKNVVDLFLKNIRGEDIPVWSQRLEKISSSVVKASFALGRPCVPHTRLAALLRNFEIMQSLFRKDPQTVSKNLRFDHFSIEWLLIGIKDPYLNLGSSGAEIMDICERLTRIEGQDTDKVDQFQQEDLSSLQKVEQAFKVLHLAFMPAYVLADTMDMSFSGELKNPLTREKYLEDQKQVKTKISENSDRLFTAGEEKEGDIVDRLGVRFYPPVNAVYYNDMYNDMTSGSVTSFFTQNKPVLRREIRTRIIEGVVAVHDYGAGETGSNANFREFRYNGTRTTPQAIQDELIKENLFGNCSPSLCKRLQLMQTAPEDRVRNTILLFAEHSSLLNDSDWQRVFELNLFRSGYLYKKLYDDPGFANELAVHLEILANNVESGETPLGFMTALVAKVENIMKSALHKPEANKDAKKVLGIRKDLVIKLNKQLEIVEKHIKEDGATLTVEYQNDCRDWLLSMAERAIDDISEDEVISFSKRHLLLSTFPRSDEHEDELATINDAVDRLLPRLSSLLKKNKEKLTEVTELRLKISDSEAWKSDEAGIVWSNGTQALNIQKGQLRLVKIPEMPLPNKVKLELQGLSSAAKRASYPFSTHKINDKSYKQIEIKEKIDFKDKEFKVFIPYVKTDEPIILMKMEDGKWYQKQNNPFSKSGLTTLPRMLHRLQCWSNLEEKTIRFLDEKGGIRAEGNFDETGVMSNIYVWDGSERTKLFSPADISKFKAFHRMDKADGLLLLDVGGQPKKILYSDLGLGYEWNDTFSKWESTMHPEYFLSDKDLKEVLQPLSRKQAPSTTLPKFFTSLFSDYHLIENKDSSIPARVLLSGREYTPHIEGENVALRKHARQRFVKNPLATDPPMLFTFETDPEKGLCSRQPSAYLYLSYVLYTQGKYPQASLAMRQAFNRMQGLTNQSREILNFFDRWPVKEPNAHALRTQLALYAAEQEQMEQVDGTSAVEKEVTLKKTMDLYLEYLETEKGVDPQLKMAPEMHDKFKFIARHSRTWITQELEKHIPKLPIWKDVFSVLQVQDAMKTGKEDAIKKALNTGIQDQIKSLEKKKMTTEEDLKKILELKNLLENFDDEYDTCKNALEKSFIDFKDLQFYVEKELIGKSIYIKPIEERKKAEALLRWSLDREIEQRIISLPNPQSPEVQEGALILQKGIPIFTNFESFFERAGPQTAQPEKIRTYLAQLESVFSDSPDSYAAEMAKEIADDVRAYCKMIGEPLEEAEEKEEESVVFSGIQEGADLNQLREQIQIQGSELKTKVDQLQNKIIALFNLGKSTDTTLRKLKEQDPVVLDIFRQGRWCYGLSDWKGLIDKGVINEHNVDTISQLYKEYLTKNSQIKQVKKIEKQIALLEALKENKSAEGKKLIAMLQVERHYDIDSNPYAPAMLLLEDELEIVCSKNQVQHFLDMITHRGSFKHEAWGGGKTSVLRHLITKFHANGAFASSLLTHTPLIDEHHEQLKESTALFYGQQSYRTNFSRKSPTDGIAIRREHLKLVKAVQEGGRTDQTINSLISSRHAHVLNILSLNKDSEDQDIDAVQAFGRLLNFRQKRMVVGSDELDQIMTPDHEHNYSTGSSIQLPEEVYDPALDVIRLIGSEEYKEFHSYFQVQNPVDMTAEQQKQLLTKIAKDLFTQYAVVKISEEDLMKYWMPMPEDISREEFDEYKRIHEDVKKEKNAKRLQSVQVLLSTILPTSFHGKVGVNFMRSFDGVHTKPCSNSGFCNESSQHGSLHLMAWYTCLDVFKTGIQPQSQSKAIETYISRLKEAAEQQRKGNNLTLDETEVAKEFKRNFNLILSKVVDSDYSKIAECINNNVELKIHFMKKANFESATFHSKRLMGNAKQAAHDVSEIWGSSGNSERARTLPKKVLLHEGLKRQKGTIGMIFYNFIKDYEKGDIVVRDPSKSLPEFIMSQLSFGSAFIDVAPFFEGLKPEECVEQLASVPSLKKPIRYVNSEGNVMIRLKTGNEVADDGTTSPEEYITLFCHADRRGRNLLLPQKSEHLITVSFDTTLTDFSQGGMRARGWGKGQKLRYFVDQGLSQKINRGDQLDPCVLLFSSLIENEVAKLQKLHTMSTRQEIMAVGDAAVQYALRHATDKNSLFELRKICGDLNYLELSAEVDFESLSRPKYPEPSIDNFQGLVSAEKERLNKFKLAIQKSTNLSEETKEKCIQAIDVAILELDPNSLIMDAKYLTSTISAGDMLSAEETVEVEQEQEAQQEVAVEQEEEVQVEKEQEAQQEVAVEQEEEVQVEKEQEREREVEEEREEARVKSKLVMWPIELNAPSSVATSNKVNEVCVFGKKIYVSTAVTPNNKYGLWLNSEGANRQLLAPSILLVYNQNTNDVKAIMGTAKDADHTFETYSQKMKEEGFTSIHYKFGDQRPLSEVLASLTENPAALKEAKKQIICAKLLYGGGITLSEEEVSLFKNELQVNSVEKGRLVAYVKRHFPPTEQEILTII